MYNRFIKGALGAGCVCAALGIVFSYYVFKKSDYVADKSLIVDGQSMSCVVKLFSEKKISPNSFVTTCCLKIFEYFSKKVQFGEYEFPDHVSLIDALEIVTSGRVVIHKLLLPGGSSTIQIVKRLEQNESLLGEITHIPEEGSLMPDVYVFRYPTTKDEIIQIAQRAMRQFIDQAWQNRSPDCTLKSPKEAIILASIVEKERAEHDGAIIAGVYLNRLRIGMKLQACPTAIYAITKGKGLGRPLSLSDLKTKSPHNTYMFPGLPPTAIANPDKTSIMSVLHPEKHDYLFFAHDGNRKIYLAKTYEEHKKNANKTRPTFKNLKYRSE